MSPGNELTYQQLNLSVDGVRFTVTMAGRGGELDPVVFLHGFGSTKEDYADIALQPAFAGCPFLAYDAPGCGETWCEDLSEISIPFLVNTAQTVLRQAGIGPPSTRGYETSRIRMQAVLRYVGVETQSATAWTTFCRSGSLKRPARRPLCRL